MFDLFWVLIYSLYVDYVQDPFLGLSKEALNKGNCHIVSTSPPSVYTTFLKQFQKDFELFLKSRSEELVPGGAMVLVLLVKTETPRRSIWEAISLTLSDMLLEVNNNIFFINSRN